MERKQWQISRRMVWWRKMVVPVRRVWSGVATRLGIRNSGILKLQHDVKACQYEDVHIMWEMLQRNELDRSPARSKNKVNLWNIFGWARSGPSLCRNF
ncbi:hypothetical protein UlMin_035362 [Ulmus minor]